MAMPHTAGTRRHPSIHESRSGTSGPNSRSSRAWDATASRVCLSGAMGSALASALISRRRCSRFMPVYYIWRGAPNESELAPETRRTMVPS